MRKSHFEQTLVAAGAAEATRFHSAERQARVGRGRDQIVDQNEPGLDPRRE